VWGDVSAQSLPGGEGGGWDEAMAGVEKGMLAACAAVVRSQALPRCLRGGRGTEALAGVREKELGRAGGRDPSLTSTAALIKGRSAVPGNSEGGPAPLLQT
jgi:hypothetical protein